MDLVRWKRTASVNKQLLDCNSSKIRINSVVNETTDNMKTEVAVVKRSCFNCGQHFDGNHRRSCPAFNVKCHSCGLVGHFSKYCKKEGSWGLEKQLKPSEGKNYIQKVHQVAWADTRKYVNISLDQADNAFSISSLSCYHLNLNRLAVNRIQWKKRYLIQNWPM